MVFFALVGALVFLVYRPLFSLYFSQDDFFHLRISQTDGRLISFLNLFSFKSFEAGGRIYFYRPIFRESLFNIYYSLWGLQALPFRIIQIFIHFINIFLTFIFVKKLTKNRVVASVASAFFALSSANLGVLYYLAGGIQASGASLFILLGLISFLEYLEKGKTKFYLLSFISFALSLASHEIAMFFPVLLVGVVYFKTKMSKKNITQFFKYWPFFLLLVVYFYLDFSVIGLPVQERQYGFNFSPLRIINSYFWYFVWSLGAPEMLLDFVGPGFKLNPNLLKFWGDYFRLIFPLFLISVFFIFLTIKNLIKDKILRLLVFWFIIAVGPVAILPFHRSTYYLAPALPAVGGIVGLVVDKLLKKSKVLASFFLMSLLLLSLVSVRLGDRTYWAITRAKIAEKLLKDIKSNYPTLPKGASVYITNDPNYPFISQDWGGSSKQASIILSGSDALALVYNDETIKVFYEDLHPKPDGTVYTQKAVVNQD